MLVFGCKRYGQDTGNPACTYKELQYAQSTGKKIILLRMIPKEEEFDYPAASALFNMGDEHECFEWLPETLMAPELPKQIAMAMGLDPSTHVDEEGGIVISMSGLSHSSTLHLPKKATVGAKSENKYKTAALSSTTGPLNLLADPSKLTYMKLKKWLAHAGCPTSELDAAMDKAGLLLLLPRYYQPSGGAGLA